MDTFDTSIRTSHLEASAHRQQLKRPFDLHHIKVGGCGEAQLRVERQCCVATAANAVNSRRMRGCDAEQGARGCAAG
jgi:hypothetical protein